MIGASQRGFAPTRRQASACSMPADGGVEEVAGPHPAGDLGPVLAAVDMRRAQRRGQLLDQHHGLAVDEVADDEGHLAAVHAFEPGADGGERLAPARGRQLAVGLDHRHVEPAPAQAVIDEAGLVGDPLLVDLLRQARQDPHHLVAAGVDADVGPDRVHDVDRLGLLQLPGAGPVLVGLRVQRPHRAEVDDVALDLGGERSLDIVRDLHVLAAADGTQLLDPGHLLEEADAARAVDAARHVGRDQRPQILVCHRPLVLAEARMVGAVEERQVLQVALAALVADRAVQRVVDEQELEHALARLMHGRRVGPDHHVVGRRHRARRDGLGRLLHLDQAHPAVAGDVEARVVTEDGDLPPCGLAGLQHRRARRDLDLLSVDRELRHQPWRLTSIHSAAIRIGFAAV